MSNVSAEYALESCIVDPSRLPDMLERVGRRLGYDFFCLIGADLKHPVYLASQEQKAAVDAFFKGGWPEVDFRAAAAAKVRLGGVYLDYQGLDRQARLGATVYQEFYRPQRMANCAGVRFRMDGEEWYCAASRSEEKGEVDADEAQDFSRIARSAIKVVCMGSRLQEAYVRGSLDALVSAGVSAIVLDHEGRVQLVTPAAERLLAMDFTIRRRQLAATRREDQVRLDALAALARSRSAVPPGHSFLVYGEGRLRPVRISAARIGGHGLDAFPGARLLLTLSEARSHEITTGQQLRNAYRLTEAEAEIAVLIGDGHEIPTIAERREVSPETVRVQLKSIFRKMGVSRQVDVARIVARLRG